MEDLLKVLNNKEKYYKKAEEFLDKEELPVEIDYDKFEVDRKAVYISLKPVRRRDKEMIRILSKYKNIIREKNKECVTVFYFVIKMPREE